MTIFKGAAKMHKVIRLRIYPSLLLLITVSITEISLAAPIDTGLFTQNRVRQCSSDTACIGGDPTIEVQSDFDPSVTGQVSTQVVIEALGAQAATSAGFDGEAFTPAMSAYAFTSGPQRYTIVSFGFQKYVFLQAGQVTLSGTVTYSHSGQTSPQSQNPRGRVSGSLMSFQFNDNEFDGDDCNIFTSYSASNAAGILSSCVTRNGQQFGSRTISFTGLENVQHVVFPIPLTPASNGSVSAELVVTGNAGDVFFVGARLGVQAHLGGWGDTGNTLRIEVDNPEILEPAFTEETFEPAPPRVAGIDIKPGDDENCFNINGHGVIPVAIFGGVALDVLQLDPYSLSFGGLAVRVRGNKGPLCHVEYLDTDEYPDLVCQFEDEAENWEPGVGDASVLGTLFDGSEFMGTDTICIVP